MKKQVLVAGVSGYIGRYAAAEFASRGYSVRGLARHPGKLSIEGPNFEPPVDTLLCEVITADAVQPDTFRDSCKGADIVFSSMGLTKPQPNVTCEEIDHLGNRAILEDALSNGVGKFIYISAFNAGSMMDLEIVRAHEEFVDDLRASGISYTVIRPSVCFSDLGMVLSMARSGHAFLFGDGTIRINPIHGADLAKVCADAAESGETEINAGGPEIYTYNEVYRMAFEAVDKHPSIIHVPLWAGDGAVFLAGLFNRSMAENLSFPLSVSRIDHVAPAYGTRKLRDFFRDIAAKGT
jgi:uncharacterized protein YbjT (DUF2867 family)